MRETSDSCNQCDIIFSRSCTMALLINSMRARGEEPDQQYDEAKKKRKTETGNPGKNLKSKIGIWLLGCGTG